MAWKSSGSTNAALIMNLTSNGIIKSERVKNAMLAVDRAHFAPTSPYADSPQWIDNRATISAPHMHAIAAETLLPYLHLHPQPPQHASASGARARSGLRVLDVGSGSGYLTAVLAHLVGPGGKVVGVDHIQSLVDMANANVAKSEDGKAMLESGRLKFVKGDGRLGFTDHSDDDDDNGDDDDDDTGGGGGKVKGEGKGKDYWDAIHVGAAAEVAHQELVDQLRAPGRLFIPVGREEQHIWVIDKKEDGSVVRESKFGVQYVPLTDAPTGRMEIN